MNMSELLRLFKFCPICKETLLQNPYYGSKGAVYCPEHGDYFFQPGLRGMPEAIVFRTYPEVLDDRYAPSVHRMGQSILCQSNGVYYASVTAAATDLGLDRSNIFRHLKNRQKHRSVGGFTFVYVDRERSSNINSDPSEGFNNNVAS